jgi:parallel beta-helix repeat protein
MDSCPYKGLEMLETSDAAPSTFETIEPLPAELSKLSVSPSYESNPNVHGTGDMVLPEELVNSILSFLPWREWAGSWRCVSKHFSPFNYYTDNARAVTIVPSQECPTLRDGISHAHSVTRELVILPGVYRQALRVTKNIDIYGAGPLGTVIIEAKGWEDALYFAGLGIDGGYVDYKRPDSGEKAVVRNLVFDTPNPEQTFVAHIVRGTPTIEHCEIRGGIWMSGATNAIIKNCRIVRSRSSGLKVSDRASPTIDGNVIESNQMSGIMVLMLATPIIKNNIIRGNGARAIDVTHDSTPVIHDNVQSGNCLNELSMEMQGYAGESRELPSEGFFRIADIEVSDDDQMFGDEDMVTGAGDAAREEEEE